MKGYCVKCKHSEEMKSPKETKTKNGRTMMKGECAKCGTTMCVFIKATK